MTDGLAHENPRGRFFASIRDYFHIEPHGRYFSVLLHELAHSEPRSFCALLSLMKANDRNEWDGWDEIKKKLRANSLRVTREHTYKQGRRADLCLLDDGVAKVLFEIKEFDGKSKENPEQVKSYVDHISKDAAFVFVSRFAPEPAVQRALGARPDRHVIALRYYDIYNALKKCTAQTAPIARMICEYMEDIAVVGYRLVDLKKEKRHVAFLLTQLLGFPHKHGMGKNASDDAVAATSDIQAKLFGDLEVIGDWIRGPNRDLICTRFSRRFAIQPYLDLKRLKKNLKVAPDEVGMLPKRLQSYVKGGVVSFGAFGSLRSKGGWLGVEVGYALEIADKALRVYLYADFEGPTLDWEENYAETTVSVFPGEAAVQKELRHLLLSSHKKALKGATGATKVALSKFKIPDA